MNHYPIHIIYSQADEGYIAEIEGLPYCLGFGLSPIMALHELLETKERMIKNAREQGSILPRSNPVAVEKNVFRVSGRAIWNN
jgi:predicted RNase H-like HicB family nuclease